MVPLRHVATVTKNYGLTRSRDEDENGLFVESTMTREKRRRRHSVMYES